MNRRLTDKEVMRIQNECSERTAPFLKKIHEIKSNSIYKIEVDYKTKTIRHIYPDYVLSHIKQLELQINIIKESYNILNPTL